MNFFNRKADYANFFSTEFICSFAFQGIFSRLEVPVNVTLKGIYKGKLICYFHRPGHSTTSFVISDDRKGRVEVAMDGLSSYDDYKFFLI